MVETITAQLTVPATLGGVREMDAWVVAQLQGQVDEATLQGVELAVHEIGVNVVEHAYPGSTSGDLTVVVTLPHASPRLLTIELQDRGVPFDQSHVTPVDLSVPHEGGYGLFLAEALMDTVRYIRRGDRNIWRLEKTI